MIHSCSNTTCTWQKIIAWLPVIGLLMVLSASPFGWSSYQRIGLYILGFGYLADYLINRRWQGWKWHSSKWIYVVMLALVALFFIREWFDPTPLTEYAGSQFHLHEWFLYIGIAGLLGFSDKLQLKHVAYVMLATSIVMFLTCGYIYLFTDECIWGPPFARFNFIRRTEINSHMVMNLYINTAIIMGFCVLKDEASPWRKVLLILAILCSWAFILLSDGRIGQATSFIIMLTCGWMALPRKKWYVSAIVAVLFAIGVGTFMLINPRVSLERAVHDPREAIYDFSWRMIQKKPIVGYGLSTLSNEYVEQAYQDSVMYNGFIASHIQTVPEFAQLGKTMMTHHAHNAFLHYWLIFGIAGPIWLVAFFVVAACMPVGKKNRIYLWLFLLAVFIQCMTEPIGYHIKPQFITLILFAWQLTALPAPKNEEPCES